MVKYRLTRQLIYVRLQCTIGPSLRGSDVVATHHRSLPEGFRRGPDDCVLSLCPLSALHGVGNLVWLRKRNIWMGGFSRGISDIPTKFGKNAPERSSPEKCNH